MPKYFMSGTRWERWERMMMDPSRRPEPGDLEDENSSRGKTNTKERSAEKNAVSRDTQ